MNSKVTIGDDSVKRKILNISWLGDCPCCGADTLKVSTEKGIGCFLFEGDLVICPNCNKQGIIEVSDNIAFVEWDLNR